MEIQTKTKPKNTINKIMMILYMAFVFVCVYVNNVINWSLVVIFDYDYNDDDDDDDGKIKHRIQRLSTTKTF